MCRKEITLYGRSEKSKNSERKQRFSEQPKDLLKLYLKKKMIYITDYQRKYISLPFARKCKKIPHVYVSIPHALQQLSFRFILITNIQTTQQ